VTLLSLAAFAKTHGASRQAAAKWRDKGALVFDGDKVDAERSDVLMEANGFGRFKSAARHAIPMARPAKRQAAPRRASADADPDDDGEGEEELPSDEELKDFVENLLQGRFLSKVGAGAIKENSLALKHLIAAKKAAGSVIEIEVAQAIFFETARGERDAWMSFPTRVGPLLAADLDIETDRVVEALTVHVQQQLEQLGEPAADFTVGQD
jgi:hypothetical protein